MSVSIPDKLVEAYSQVGSANRRSLEALAVVLTQFRAYGIACILLKGADILPRLYGVWGLRPMIDADLLVRDRDLPAIDRIVRDLGYVPQIDGNPAYHNPASALTLDILTEIWYTDDQEGIWQRAAHRCLGDLPVLGMGAEDLLIFLTAYVVLHRGHFSPTFPQDLALLIRKESLNWDFILEEAGRRNLTTPLYYGLTAAFLREPLSLPSHVLASLAPSCIAGKILDSMLRKLVTDKPLPDIGHFLLLMTRPGGQKLRWLWRYVFPSRNFLRYRYGERGAVQPILTRLLRAGRLMIQASLLAARIVVRLITPVSSMGHPRL
jgi:hypothetical protein